MFVSYISNNSYTQPKPSFRACLVEKVKPKIVIDNVTFLNNKTAMLKEGVPFFDGIKLFIDTTKHILQNNLEWITTFDNIELMRFLNILRKFPKEPFEKRKMYGIIGTGAYKTAFLLDKKEVLCACDNMKVFKERPFEDFDLPILSEGYCDKHGEFGWFIRNHGKPINEKELKSIEERIWEKGYSFEDWYEDQCCKFKNKIYLLDFECVKKKKM